MSTGLARAELDRFGGDALGVLEHLRRFGDFPAAGHRHAGEVARLASRRPCAP